MKKACVAYLHAEKETMWKLGEEMGLKGEALAMFRHACTEVEVELMVDTDTGLAEIVGVDGRKVEEK